MFPAAMMISLPPSWGILVAGNNNLLPLSENVFDLFRGGRSQLHDDCGHP